jgi:hypothetical protein
MKEDEKEEEKGGRNKDKFRKKHSGKIMPLFFWFCMKTREREREKKLHAAKFMSQHKNIFSLCSRTSPSSFYFILFQMRNTHSQIAIKTMIHFPCIIMLILVQASSHLIIRFLLLIRSHIRTITSTQKKIRENSCIYITSYFSSALALSFLLHSIHSLTIRVILIENKKNLLHTLP